MLKYRVATAVVAVPFLIYLIGYGGLPYAILLAVASIIGILEFSFMFFQTPEERFFAYSASLVASILSIALLLGFLPGGKLPFAFVAAALSLTALAIYTSKSPEDAYNKFSKAILLLVYMPLLVWFIYLVREFGGIDPFKGWQPSLLLFGATWMSDTGGYFGGKYFGKRPLAPSISPKKTVEGLFGGMLFAVLFCGIFTILAYPNMAWYWAALFGAAATVWGQTGDLVESAMKRVAGVKDSGKILPGHGGMLDRIDALLFNAPLMIVWLYLFSC